MLHIIAGIDFICLFWRGFELERSEINFPSTTWTELGNRFEFGDFAISKLFVLN